MATAVRLWLDKPQTVGDARPDRRADADRRKPEAEYDSLPADRHSAPGRRSAIFGSSVRNPWSVRPKKGIRRRHHIPIARNG